MDVWENEKINTETFTFTTTLWELGKEVFFIYKIKVQQTFCFHRVRVNGFQSMSARSMLFILH